MTSPLDDLASALQCTLFPVQVLVVDDDVAARSSMRRVLEQKGYGVLVAESGEHALDLLGQTHLPVDLLVTDVQMPGMAGNELARLVRESWPELPVLFVSGEPEFAPLAVAAGGRSRFLQKPFAPDELTENIQAVLRPPGQREPVEQGDQR